jgi:hypothetical protein
MEKISKQEFDKIKTEENNAINALVETLGLKVKHFYDRDAWGPNLGGFAVAYSKQPRDSFVVLSTAVCSSKERYCRKIGKSLAVNNYLQGRVITLPVPKWMTASEVIHMYFAYKN